MMIIRVRSKRYFAHPGALLLVVCGSASGNVDDQSVAAAKRDQNGTELAEIIVTGSRIARPELERLQPTTILTSEFLDKRAYTNVMDALSELPAFGPPDNNLVGSQSSEGVGQSFANFFSLGSQRTLVLIDGRRFVPENTPSPFGPTSSGGEQVDLNVIPTQLIDRIETIAVGGAPIYGSDAIAGTVNIILKHNYQGLDIDVQGGISGHGDASQSRLRLLTGKNLTDGRGNITFNAEVANSGGLVGSQRLRYAEQLAYVEPTSPSPYTYVLTQNLRLGSLSTSGIPMVDDGFLNFNPNFAITNPAGRVLAFSNGRLAPYALGSADGSGVYNIGGGGVNFGEITTLLTPQERVNLTSLGNFQINDNVRVFGELWYSETHNDYPIDQGPYDSAVFAPAGQVSGNLILSATNPFLSPADQATIMRSLSAYAALSPMNPQQTGQFYLARLNEDIQRGGATADQNTKRAVLGVDGTVTFFGNEFQFGVSGNYGRSRDFSVSPSLNWNNYQNALNAVIGPTGQIICNPLQPNGQRIVNSPAPTESSKCAPFNPFGNGIASPAAFAYVTSLGTELSTLTQRDFNASLTGALFSLPAGAVKAAFGFENRRESADYVPSLFFQQGDGYAVPLAPIAGSFSTNEVFGELLVPVIAPAESVPFVHRAEFEGAAREVDHSIAGKELTWTAGLRFEPVSVLQFRGNYTRALRSPSVTEAYLPNAAAYGTAADPCDQTLIKGGPDPSVRAANCAKAGITQPFYSNILNITEPITITGDPNLKNEVADSRALGFVLRPSGHTSLSVDYVKIDISQAIEILNTTNVLDACYDSPTYPNAYCSKLVRNSAGQVTFVQTGYANAGFEDFNGVQTEFDWSFEVPLARSPGALGTMDIRINEFFTNRLSQAVGSSDVTVYAGQLGNSRHRGVININWHKRALYSLWEARFIGRAAWDNSLPAANTQLRGVGNWWVHNLTLGYDAGSRLTLQLVIDNVFDKEAPYPLPATPPNSSGGNGIETYFSGVLGRYFVGRVAYKF